MRLRMLGVVIAAAAAMAGVVAAPAQAAQPVSASSHVVSHHHGYHFGKGRTDLTLDPAAAGALTSLGVKVSPVLAKVGHPAGKTVFGFTIVGNPNDGTIEHVGGLLLRAGGKCLYLTSYTIDLKRGVLSGRINFGARADLFTIGAATADGVTLALTAPAAALLNKTFGVTAFTQGLVIGYGNPMIRK
ncbi:hypothetical protein VA596_28375 [Amycolatopsis sp., V23-08]|uniref:Uncharacterized protein n=1 Tax=Amycolatopsis heterodermiae TaxID=3110235 RepID=A0ABU5RB42_9PSEU|nr:hypothetical protein [Amycolatopsis sp., V23-08]MEA5363477.1 hypothetical protein [Amycolatopsis sp., V23-08]